MLKTLLVTLALVAAAHLAAPAASAAAPPAPCTYAAGHTWSFVNPNVSITDAPVAGVFMVAVRTQAGCSFFTSTGFGQGNCYHVEILPNRFSVLRIPASPACASFVILRVDALFNTPAATPNAPQQPAPQPNRNCGSGCTLGLGSPR